MSHRCEGWVITCKDFRLHQRKDGRNYVADFIKSLGIDCDIDTYPGGVKKLVSTKGIWSDFFESADISTRLHGARRIILLNHENCGYYPTFLNRDDEIARHMLDLKIARGILGQKFPGKYIDMYFAYLRSDTSDVFEIRQV